MPNAYKTLTIFAACVSFVTLHEARADFFIHGWHDMRDEGQTLSVQGDAGLYTTSSNFDSNGKKNTPSGLNSLTRVGADLTGIYGFNAHLSFFGRASWVRVELDHSTKSANAYGLADQSVGANFRLMGTSGQQGPVLDVQAQGDFPAYSNSSAQTAGIPYLGDGSTDVTGGAFAKMALTKIGDSVISGAAGGGYTYRTAGFSAALPWSVLLSFEPATEGISANVCAHGIFSLKTDSSTSGSQSSGSSVLGSGGSFLTNAVNPFHVTAQARVGYRFASGTIIHVSGAKTMFGQNAPEGLSVSAGIKFGLGQTPQVKPISASNKGFVNYSLEAKVTRVNDRLSLVKLDKGSQDGLEVGQTFDIFTVKKDGSIGEAVARGKVTDLRPNEAAVSITEYFKEVLIDEGFIAKRPLQ